MVKAGILAMAAAITIVIAGSWLHASASPPRPMVHASIDVLALTLSARRQIPVQRFDAI
jgi:hypothetical protein